MANVAKGNATENSAIVGIINPASISAGTANTTVIDMRYIREVEFTIITGTLGASATVDFVVRGDTASGGSFTTAITGKSITQLVKASHDNVQVRVRVTAEEAAAQGFRYLRGLLTVGTATSVVGVMVMAYDVRYSPATSLNLASVVQTIL